MSRKTQNQVTNKADHFDVDKTNLDESVSTEKVQQNGHVHNHKVNGVKTEETHPVEDVRVPDVKVSNIIGRIYHD